LEFKDLAPFVNLVITLAMGFYVVGTLKGLYASKAELAALDKELRGLIATKERDSEQSHRSFLTKDEFTRFEGKCEKKWEQIEVKVDVVNRSLDRLINLYHREHKSAMPKDVHHDG